jgi:hypothetical protein
MELRPSAARHTRVTSLAAIRGSGKPPVAALAEASEHPLELRDDHVLRCPAVSHVERRHRAGSEGLPRSILVLSEPSMLLQSHTRSVSPRLQFVQDWWKLPLFHLALDLGIELGIRRAKWL